MFKKAHGDFLYSTEDVLFLKMYWEGSVFLTMLFPFVLWYQLGLSCDSGFSLCQAHNENTFPASKSKVFY